MSVRKATRSLVLEQLECRRLLAINPSAEEQEVLQYINRFRTDPGGEFNRLFSSVSPLTARNSSIQADLDFFKTNGSMLQSEFAALTPVEPLTWNEAINSFSATHNNSMIAENRLFHTDPLARRSALITAGVNLDTVSGERINSEIVFAQIKSPLHNYAAYAVNWGTGSGGMQTGRSHRTALTNPVFEEIGGKITSTSASALAPKVNTFVIANIRDAAVRVGGSVFEDKNGSTWYEAGEGLGGVSVSFEHTDGRKFSTTSFSAGGYQMDLPTGSYKVRVSGGSMQKSIARTLAVADASLWVNFIYNPNDPAIDANEPNDAAGFATNVSAPSAMLASLSLHSGSDVDFYKYVPVGTGIAKYELQFTNASGDINLQLLNAGGQVLASSTTTGNGEQIQFQADAGTVYFLRVFGAANPNYTIKVTGPEAISQDAQEPNNSLQTATMMSGTSPTLSSLSLHSNKDIDFYRYDAGASGQATFGVQFTQASGNIDIELLDATGAVLATSAGTVDNESIVRQVLRNATYYLRVYGGPNKAYTVRVTGPSLQAPVALRDQTTVTSDAPNTLIAILNNDFDPDGSRSELVPSFQGDTPAGFKLNTDKTVSVQAPAGFSGMLRAGYTVMDADGLRSSSVNIEVLVIDYSRQNPWQNPIDALDANGDNTITPSDALLVINFLNDSADKRLPISGSTSIFGFLDVTGGGLVSPTDALRVINQLNSRSVSEGESSFDQSYLSDLALFQLMSGDFVKDIELRKRRAM